MSYNHLRTGRHSMAGQVYHVTTVTRARLPIFRELRAGRVVVRELMALQAEGLTQTLCFVVMPDHLHWLFALQLGALGDAVQRLKGRTARTLNGSVWQPGYHDHALRKEDDLKATARYIVANPLRAGLVQKMGDYPLWDAVWLAE